MTWTQVYTPLGNLHLSALVAAIPVVVLLGALAFFHVKAHIAALLGLLLALGIAVGVYGMPLSMAAASAGYGAAFGLLPIGWIILNAIFIYDITVKTGKFEVVKDTIGGLAGDRRIQVLLIAFAFGAFIEGAAGFGTPVAISAAMLIGLGFKPLAAAGLALIGNTAPVAYGALGTPIITLAKVTGLNELALSVDGGPPAPALLAHRPVLARVGDGRLPRHARRLAGVPRRRASRSPSRSSSSRTSSGRTSSTSSRPRPASSPPTCS